MSDRTKVKVKFGVSYAEDTDFVGKTVAEIRSMVSGTRLNIPADATPFLNGTRVPSNYQFQAGDELTFIKESGSKG